MLKGFKTFLLQGDLIIVAVGLVVALAFSGLISAFTTNIINPILALATGGKGPGLGWFLKDGAESTFLNLGAFIAAVIYFIIFVAVVYFLIVVPYRSMMARRGKTVFGPPAPVKTCPACLSADIPEEATKCKYCGTDQPPAPASATAG